MRNARQRSGVVRGILSNRVQRDGTLLLSKPQKYCIYLNNSIAPHGGKEISRYIAVIQLSKKQFDAAVTILNKFDQYGTAQSKERVAKHKPKTA